MTDQARQDLIERVRSIREDAYLTATYLGDEHVGDLLSDVLAVFEEATAPTRKRQVQYNDGEWSREYVVEPEPESILNAATVEARR